jgi:hypothetical protein
MLGPFSSDACAKFFKTDTHIWQFHRVNSLYNGTINCFSTLVQSSTAFNEMFNYKQALQEPDYHKFVKATVNKKMTMNPKFIGLLQNVLISRQGLKRL